MSPALDPEVFAIPVPAPGPMVTRNQGRARVIDLDKRRIERALRQRVRYRYVRPLVLREVAGWRILSPCCSRNIDAQGGVIDIAWLRKDPPVWRLYARNHAQGIWVEHERSENFIALLDAICLDPQRVFWP